MKHYLNVDLDTADLSMREINLMYFEHIWGNDYDTYYKVQPGDVVVDVGACVGLFTMRALQNGASKVYAIEPNKKYLRTLMSNATEHAIDHKGCRVVPVHGAIGNTSRSTLNCYGDQDGFPLLRFKDFLEEYEIDHIDFLKIDCEGGEYDIFIEENLDFLKNKVRHMAVEFHLNCFREAPFEWISFRDHFIYNFHNEKTGKIPLGFLNPDHYKRAWDTDKILGEWPVWNGNFMVYITNW
jgi:FkbM family methyltransferase